MPPLPGEERMLTVFADIHYYFTAPTPKPLYHRFDKGSYFYLYHNASSQKLRVEVANNPGTSDQDAFNGALDHVHLRHSTTFPTLCTLTVDNYSQQTPQEFPPPPSTNLYEWHLPKSDAQGGNTDLQRLHTLDIYFWTIDDANSFLDVAERYLSQSQIDTDRHPFPAPTEVTASSVVQQLENVAITDPAYQNGQTPNSRSEAPPNPASHAAAASPVLPPPRPVSVAQHMPVTVQPQEVAQFTPLPYNPAAPAAPEPIQHREKTPPPIDAADGTGLAAAAAVDSGAPMTPPTQLFGGGYAPPPSQGVPYSLPGSYASPPPSAGLTHSGSFSSRSSIQSPPGVPSYTPAFLVGSGQPVTQAGTTMSFAPPPVDPNAHLYGQSLYTPPPPTQVQPTSPPPIGGYSNYSYEAAPPSTASAGGYDMHKQLYRPTEAEANSHAQKYAQKAVQNPTQRSRTFENGASRVESSVNRFLKKLERKF
ncbi:uncharacterized protein ACLA_081540 [Aspergillus clavatus NRRL 1]|uniref:RNA recognition motif-containing protein n=1 Tax=Aspergillus clavatus (strain ATCC 1007 / CBS 513.65 / DSM 816 / NCTC 3887 / NRRL 1 / QM 1276 / 107) TaxID=344612 RepID=A1CT27_ASPCL|nr:uncharacterized protein ACLA_081540 [Aspergillus clavatus NRRL 1]EAW06464.1 conserved hypothetical protein [Aspergillus clavatus NRRL 1]